METTEGLGQRDIKGATKECFLFDSWFSSKSFSEAAMDVGGDMVGMVKTDTNGFCKYAIDNLTKYWPVDSYLVFKRNSLVPGDRPIVSIGYKYNA